MTSFIRKRLTALLHSDRGATAIEYGLIVSIIVLGAFAAFSGLADETIEMWTTIQNNVADAS